MQKDFWIEKWNKGETHFHKLEANPFLRKFWHETGAKEGDAVFVPLCGKSRDMLWLRDQGHSVIGVEFSPLAVADFFAENGLKASTAQHGRLQLSDTGNIRLFCGDVFDLAAEDVKPARAGYDRAALIALPPDLRRKYAGHLLNILPPRCSMLLITLEYPEGAMEGPPFSVREDEVRSLFAGAASVKLLDRHDALDENSPLRARGLSELSECAYLIVR
jgi:thiopurine S-methyltransferase